MPFVEYCISLLSFQGIAKSWTIPNFIWHYCCNHQVCKKSLRQDCQMQYSTNGIDFVLYSVNSLTVLYVALKNHSKSWSIAFRCSFFQSIPKIVSQNHLAILTTAKIMKQKDCQMILTDNFGNGLKKGA